MREWTRLRWPFCLVISPPSHLYSNYFFLVNVLLPPTHLTELMCFLAIDWAIFFLHVKEFYCNMCCLTSTYKLDPPMSHLWWTHHKLIPARTAASINTSVSVFIKLWLFFSKLWNFAFMFSSWWPIYFFYSSPIFFQLVTLISLFHIKCIIAHCLLHHWIWSFAVHFWAWEQALQGKEGAGGERVRKMNGYRDGGGGRGGGGDGREPLLQLPIFHFAPLSPPSLC